MRFQPSVYSDVAAVAPDPAPATPLSNVATAATALSEIVGAGTAAWDAVSAAKMAKWQQKAAKKKRVKKRAAAPSATPMTPTVAAAAMPAPAAKPATDWTKWGLIGMGALALGIVAYLALRPKPEAEKAKKNPAKPTQRGAFIRTPPKRRIPKVIDVEAETVDEDPPEPMDDEDDGAFAGTDEGEE